MLPIYCEHFSLKREPFNITPDPGFLYFSESHKEALAQLVYGVKGRRGFVVLTGEVGTGKTTLIHCLLNELDGNTKTAMVFNMIVSATDLLRYVCEKFEILSAGDAQKGTHDYLYALEQFLTESFRNGQNTALIIDEAQNLPTEVLENVRLLSNFETATDKLLQIILVGQPELGIRLNAAELRQLKQRIALRHHLRPLNLVECKEYIARRLEVAEGSIRLFTPEALEAIHDYAGGIPRIINILCDNGLLTAYALRKPTVESGMIADVGRDLQLAVFPQMRHQPAETRGGSGAGADLIFASSRFRNWALKNTEQSNSDHDAYEGSLSDGRVSGVAVTGRDARPPVLSQVRSDRMKASGRAADQVSAGYIDYMINVLTDAMGPMASVILREQIAAMGESIDQFPRLRLADLIEETTREILSSSAKANCKRLMLERLKRIERANGGSET